MGSWGSCDFSALKDFSKRMHDIAKQEEIDAFFVGCLNQMTNGLMGAVKKKTHPVSGHMNENWFVEGAKKYRGEYQSKLYNNVEYAPWVENGHRQEVGRYVPALGKRLVKPWVEGRHMLRDSVQEAKAAAPAYLERKQRAFLQRLEGK